MRVYVAALVCLQNAERRARGRRALRADLRLRRAALNHSLDMRRRRYFSHRGRNGSTFTGRLRRAGYRWRDGGAVGENLGTGGSQLTPAALVAAWLDSPSHRDNLLDPGFTEVGVAAVIGQPDGDRGEGAIVAVEFGRPR